MTRRLMLLVLLLSAWLPAAAIARADDVTTISGGDLPQAVTLAFDDQDAFLRRIDQPPVLDEAAVVVGGGYRVTSPYWAEALKDPDKPDAEAEAAYYPMGGFVQARQDGEDVWMVLNLRQQAILNRYIRLARAGMVGQTPGLLEVLSAASRSETIGVQVGERILTPQEAGAFWLVASGLKPIDARPVEPDTSSRTWIVFSLPEGRSLQMVYSRGDGNLTDALAHEVYIVPDDWLRPVLGNTPFTTGQIDQEADTGSLAWWAVMLAAGLACIGVAVLWLRRLPPKRSLDS